jgi:hypothetical protein
MFAARLFASLKRTSDQTSSTKIALSHG